MPPRREIVRDLLVRRVALSDPEEMHDMVGASREYPYWHVAERLVDRWRPRRLRLAEPRLTSGA
jgi:hypothetical protein